MSTDYATPPTLAPALESDLKALADIIAKNADDIMKLILDNAVRDSGVIPNISSDLIVGLMKTVIIPQLQHWEVGWCDHPGPYGVDNSQGAMMRGVLLQTLRNTYDNIFINTDIQEVKSAASNFNKKYPTWKTDPQLGKQVLFILCGNDSISGLFFYYFSSIAGTRFPIAVMTIDPWLGYFFAVCVWSSGGAMYDVGQTDIDSVAKAKYGWKGGNSQAWVNFIAGLGDKTAEFAVDCFVKRHGYIKSVSIPTSNAVFGVGWLDRLVNNDWSELMMLVKINEIFNLNTSSTFIFTPTEKDYLYRKAQTYKSLNLTIPD